VRQVDPVVFNMLSEDPGKVDYSMIGGLSEQIRELRESIELPLLNPELFQRVGINPPKVQLLGRSPCHVLAVCLRSTCAHQSPCQSALSWRCTLVALLQRN